MNNRNAALSVHGERWYLGLHDDFKREHLANRYQALDLFDRHIEDMNEKFNGIEGHRKQYECRRDFFVSMRDSFSPRGRKRSKYSSLTAFEPIEVKGNPGDPSLIPGRFSLLPEFLNDDGCDKFAELVELTDSQKQAFRQSVSVARDAWHNYLRQCAIAEPDHKDVSASRFLGLLGLMKGELNIRGVLSEQCEAITNDAELITQHPEYRMASSSYYKTPLNKLAKVIEQYPLVVEGLVQQLGLSEDAEILDAVHKFTKPVGKEYGETEVARDIQEVNIFIEHVLHAAKQTMRKQGEWIEWLYTKPKAPSNTPSWAMSISAQKTGSDKKVDIDFSAKTLLKNWPREEQIKTLGEKAKDVPTQNKVRVITPNARTKSIANPHAKSGMDDALMTSFKQAEAAKERLEQHEHFEELSKALSGSAKGL